MRFSDTHTDVYIAQWRRPYRKRHTLRRPPLTEEALIIREKRRGVKLLRDALKGDTEALMRIFKIMGEEEAG